MPSSDIFGDFMISKGPLSDEEVLLKELILRDTYFAKIGKKARAAVAAAQAQSSTSSAMVMEEFNGEEAAKQLPHVVPGELITAAYMNDIVDAVNALSTLVTSLVNQQRASNIQYMSRADAQAAAVVSEVKDVEVARANQDKQKAVVRIAANEARKEDIADLLIDTVRVDPKDIKEVDGKFEFMVDKALISENPKVRVVSQPGEAANRVSGLFR